MAVNILLSGGVLKLTGDAANDIVNISVDKRGTTSTADDLLVVNTNWTNGKQFRLQQSHLHALQREKHHLPRWRR